jgi:hypothetical protein
MIRKLFSLLLMLFAVSASAENLLYHEDLGGDLTDYQITITGIEADTEYILVKNHEGDELSSERILVNPLGNTIEWEFHDFLEDVHIEAARSGRDIRVVKLKKGRRREEFLRLEDERPWHQLFPFGMEDFVTKGENERSFWFIQPQNLKLSALKAVRGDEKLLTIRGTRQKAVEVVITIDNWLSRFWKGLYLLRSRDGRYLFYEGILRKNLSRGTVELVTEAR